ncbi:MAG TPA: AI-2E family transporter [Dissulfurispiraceae bacterium]|nr:AI-2E family transporter [Dissulfurispiraceae bacterium]
MLLLIVTVLGYLTFQILKPFLSPLAWAVVFSIVFYPLYAFSLRFVPWKSLASLLTVIIIVTVIIGPFSYFIVLLVAELNHLSDYLATGQFSTLKEALQHPSVSAIISRLTGTFGISEAQIDASIVDYLSRFGKELLAQVTRGAGNFIALAVNFIFMIFSIFFLLKDGAAFLQKIRDYMPFSEEEKSLLAAQMRDIIISTIYGGVVVAIAQGIIGGVAFSVLGIPSPVLWGFAVSIASFIPLIGSMAVWGPAVVYLFAHGAVVQAFALFFIGIFGISMIDYLLRPIIIGSRTKMHVLVILFSVLGGIQLFGLIGLVMGPLVLAVFISVIKIFRKVESNSELPI